MIARNMDWSICDLIWVPTLHLLQGTGKGNEKTIVMIVSRSGFEPRSSFIRNSNATKFAMKFIPKLVTAMNETLHYGQKFFLFI
jgi:hypothetical protein